MFKALILIASTSISLQTLAITDLEKIEKELSTEKIEISTANRAKALSLNAAIEQGLRLNSDQIIRTYTFKLNEIIFQNAHADYYYPRLNLVMKTTSDHNVETVYKDQLNDVSSSKTPTGYVGLEFEDYTLFNWGRDYLTFLNTKDTYNRSKETLKDENRELRLNIIKAYFSLSRQYQVIHLNRRQLKRTSFIYRLAKEKLSLRKIKLQEYLQTKSEFLRAHQEYQDSLYDYQLSQETLANLLGDRFDTPYRPTDQLRFSSLTMGEDESLKLLLTRSPEIKDALVNYTNSDRSYKRARKDNLPLPKISLKMGSYKKAFGTTGVTDSYENSVGGNNIELAASLNMKWTIFGSGGLFNKKTSKSYYYKKKIAEIQLRDAKRMARVVNHSQNSKIKYLEKKYVAVKEQLKNARRIYDKSLDNYIASKISFTSLKQILDHLVESNLAMEDTKFDHLVEKLTLASTIGIDDFPGDQFERLILQ